MNKKVKEILKNYFGYDDFKEGQESIIKSILNNKNTLGIMPTGSGKSLCYQIPALIFDGLTIIISPLISLMKDQIDFLNTIKYPAGMLNSTVPYSKQLMIKEMLERNELKLIYLTPERFKKANFLEWISNLNVSCFVIDEAHCISEWGHDFRPEYRKLKEVITKLKKPPVLALTATATEEVKKDIVASLDLKECNTIVTGFNRDNLIYGVQNHSTKEEKNKALITFINKVNPPGIIYTSSIKDSESVYLYLTTNSKKKIGVYHGSLSAPVRKKTQEDFLANNIDILVATNAFGMGVNKTDIRYVVHYSAPGSIEAYYQETGRAGRDGKESYCLLLSNSDDERIQNFFIKTNNPPVEYLSYVLTKIKKYSSNNTIYTGDLDNLFTDKKDNKHLINTAIKQLQFLGCIDLEYLTNGKIEISIKNKKITAEDKSFLEELLHSSIESKKFYSFSLDFLAKRIQASEKELKEKLEALKKAGLISFKIIKKGQTIKVLLSSIPKKTQDIYSKKAERKIKIDREKLNMILDYGHLSRCRRKYILNYFGEEYNLSNCKKCDICRGTYRQDNKIEWNDIQKSILNFFIFHEDKIGAKKAVKILKGSLDVEPKYSYWEEYGALKQHDIRDIESEVQLLLNCRILEAKKDKYSVIKLSNKGLKEYTKTNN